MGYPAREKASILLRMEDIAGQIMHSLSMKRLGKEDE